MPICTANTPKHPARRSRYNITQQALSRFDQALGVRVAQAL
jgi:hypothetical protein